MKLRTKIILGVLVVLLVVLVGGWLYLFPFDGLEALVTGTLNDLLPPRYGLTVQIDNIGGNPLSGIVLNGVTVTYTDSLHQYTILRAKKLSSSYAISHLWNKDYRFAVLEFDSLSVTIKRDSARHLITPEFASKGKGGGTTPDIHVDRVLFNGAEFHLVGPDDTISISGVSISSSFSVEDGMVSADIAQLSLAADKFDVDLRSLTGQVAYSQKTLVVRDLTMIEDGTHARISGAVNLDSLYGRLDVALDGVNLAEVQRWGGPGLKGVMDITGSLGFTDSTISGHVNLGGSLYMATFENLQADLRFENKKLYMDTLVGAILGTASIDGSGMIDFGGEQEQYALSADIRNFDLDHLVENTFESDLNGHIELSGSSFRSNTMAIDLRASLYESTFDEYPLQQADGRMIITTDSIVFPDTLNVWYYENLFKATGTVVYSDSLFLEITADLANLDRYKGKLFIDQPGGRAYAEATLSGQTSDPDLGGYLISDSLWLYGMYADSARSLFQIDRFLTGRQGWVQADFTRGTIYGAVYDTATARLTLDSTLVLMDSLSARGINMWMYATGSLDYGSEPSILRFDTARISLFERDFDNSGPVFVDIDTLGFEFRRMAFVSRGGSISVGGRIDYDETMNLTTIIDSIPMAPWLRLFRQDLDLDGFISTTARIKGSFVRPIFTVDGSVDSLTYRGLILGRLMAAADYENRLLDLDSAVIVSDSGHYFASGSINLDLSFVADSVERVPNLPFNLHIQGSDTDFDLVTLIMPSVETMDGRFQADIVLSGTPDHPQLEGEAFLKHGRIKYFDLVQPIYTDSAGVTLENNRIKMERISAYVIDSRNGRKNYAYVEGEIVVQSFDNFVYDLNVSIPRPLHFTYELEDVEAVAEGELQIVGETPPTVYGDITVISASYEVPFASPDEGSPILTSITDENSWDLNLDIEILSNYWIRNEDINAVFSGEINLIRENGQYRFIGELEIIRGRAFLWDKTFRLESGSTVIFDDIEELNPRLDIQATTRITLQTQGQGFESEPRTERVDLTVNITGTLDEPQITAASDSPFSTEDILPLLTLNYVPSDTIASDLRLEDRVADYLGRQFSQIGSRQLQDLNLFQKIGIGVESLEIDPYTEGQLDLGKSRISLGFYTAIPGLYIYGQSALSGQSGQEVGFEYRINRQLLMEGRMDEQDEYRLKVRWHWEF